MAFIGGLGKSMTESPISHHTPKGGKPDAPSTDKPDAGSAQQQKEMEAAYANMKRKMAMQKMAEDIKHKIMVLSGKGGVGKSTVATGLALSLASRGHSVGILDIDITGPNVPKMLGLDKSRLDIDQGRINPTIGPSGIKVISMAFLLEDEDTPVVWRGPIKLGAIQQFIGDVNWGELDFMIIDFPPGTSDEPLTVTQSLSDIDGMVIVTTPQDVALMDSRKSINFGKSLKVKILGVIENMSGYTLQGRALDDSGNPVPNTVVEFMAPGGKKLTSTTDKDGNWSQTLDIFKVGGGEDTAADLEVPYLGKLPFDPGIVRGCDDGVHRILSEPEGDSAIAFSKLVDNLLLELDKSGAETSLKII